MGQTQSALLAFCLHSDWPATQKGLLKGEGRAMWLFHVFMKTPAWVTLNTRTSLLSSSYALQKGKLVAYYKMVN